MTEENIEVEVTLDLDKEGYELFCTEMNSFLIDIYDQWNIFFDTVDHSLLKSNKRCRVRSIDAQNSENKYTICSKTSKSDAIDGAIARRREVENNISKELFDNIVQHPEDYCKLAPNEIQEELLEFKDISFCFLVDFRSIRRIYKLGEFNIESDECILPDDSKFYQLDIESSKPEEAKRVVEQKLNDLGIKFEEAPYGKFTRLTKVPPNKRFSKRLRDQIEQNKDSKQ